MTYFGHKIINSFRSKTPASFYDPIKGHTGIDIDTPENTAISLPVETQVAIANDQVEMGKTLYLRDSEGNYLVFAHLNSIDVQVSQIIKPGEVFAHSGNTGTATTQPHLHFEVISQKPEQDLAFMTRTLAWISGYNIDPEKYLNKIFQISTSTEVVRPPISAIDWAVEHGIISHRREPNSTVTWAEHAESMQKLAQKVLEWSRFDPNK